MRKTYSRVRKSPAENPRGGVAEEETHEACLTIKRPEIQMVGNKWQYRAVPGSDKIGIRTEAEGLTGLPTLDQQTVVYCRDCAKHGTLNCPMRYNRYIITDDDFVEEGADTDNSAPDGFCYMGVRK